MIKARNCWYHHFPPLPVSHLEFRIWFPNNPVSQSPQTCLAPESWSYFVCVLVFIPRNLRIWQLPEARPMPFLVYFGPLNHLLFLFSQVFSGHRGSRARHLRLFSAVLPGHPPLCHATTLTPAAFVHHGEGHYEAHLWWFNLSPLTLPEFRLEPESFPIAIPHGRRILFVAPVTGSSPQAAQRHSRGSRVSPAPHHERLGFSSLEIPWFLPSLHHWTSSKE